nr:esterase FE4-like [Onthophagus taurus]
MKTVTVCTKQGVVRGIESKNYKDGIFYSFYGIPYAKPPLGELRFKAPQPPIPWKHEFDATFEKDCCIAPNLYTGQIEGGEDCLHLNIYTRNVSINDSESIQLKPVIVFIHPGAFTTGNTKTEFYGPDFLMTQDIVLVLISYRLGILGWSRLDDSSLGIPGNQGLRDVIMGLKWVNENIEFFCGDPNNVTIFGDSAGAVIAHNVVLLAQCKNLVHKIIIHSGSALCHWGIGRRDSLKEAAKYLGCPSHVDKDILEFLQNQPIEKLIQGQLQAKVGIAASLPRYFYPVIEEPNNIEEPLITEDPRKVISEGKSLKIPMLIGYNSDEGLFFDYQIKNRLKKDKNNSILPDFETLVPHPLGFKRGSPESILIAEKTKQFYFNGKSPTIENRKQFYRLYLDNFFGYVVQDTARRHFKNTNQPIYFFKFAFDGNLNMYKKIQGSDRPGASHSDDLCYLFKMSKNPPIEKNSVEEKVMTQMIKLWTNFAKNGNPNFFQNDDQFLEWKPIEKNKLHYLHINDDFTVGVDPDKEAFDFWDSIYNMSPISKL